MPKVQKNKKYKKPYTEADVVRAIEAVRNGLPQRQAERDYNVPRGTLQFRMGDKFRNKTSLGPSPVLSNDEENCLKDWIAECQNKGFPVRIEDIMESVKGFLDANPRTNAFVDNRPGRGWCKGFFKRHPDISLRCPEAITAASSNISEKDIRSWFAEIEKYLIRKGYKDILDDSSRVFNGDETSFLLCPKNKRVVAVKGSRNVYEIDHNPKVNLTVMFTFEASGKVTPPMIIYPYKRLPADVAKSVPDGWGIGCSDSGWMKNDVFYEYIGNVFYKYLVKENTQFPIILFVDGHKTHLTYQTSQMCCDLGIILIALYPNSTRILQPADVSAFRPLKNNWNKAVLEFRRDNPNAVVTKENFAFVLKKAVSSLTPEAIKNGFRATGLWPWNASAIDYSKCLGKTKNANEVLVENKTIQDISITYREFATIVGDKKIKEFEEDPEFKANSKDQDLVFQIYTVFKDKFCSTTNNKLTCAEDKNAIETGLNKIPDIVKIDIIDNTDSKTFNIEDIPIVTEDQVILGTATSNIILTDMLQPEVLLSHTISNNDNILELTAHTVEASTVNKISLTNQNLLSSAAVSQASIGKYFIWPTTPERKGKKETKRSSFVITSSDRRNEERQKIEKKLEEERLKEERKQNRKLKSLNKKNGPKEKVSAKKEQLNKKKAEKIIKPGSSQETVLNNEANLQKINKNKDETIRKTDLNQEEENITEADLIRSTVLSNGIKVHLPKIINYKITEMSVNLCQEPTGDANKQDKNYTPICDQNKSFSGSETSSDPSNINRSSIDENFLQDTINYNNQQAGDSTNVIEKHDNTEPVENETEYRYQNPLRCQQEASSLSSSAGESQKNISQINLIKRNLFKDEPTKESKICVLSNVKLDFKNDKNFYKNETYKGMCYNCVLNITSSKVGVRCNSCLRTYHLSCLEEPKCPNSKLVCFNCENVKN